LTAKDREFNLLWGGCPHLPGRARCPSYKKLIESAFLRVDPAKDLFNQDNAAYLRQHQTEDERINRIPSRSI